jgi:hypothetical protein
LIEVGLFDRGFDLMFVCLSLIDVSLLEVLIG